jgi:hypothetical protein
VPEDDVIVTVLAANTRFVATLSTYIGVVGLAALSPAKVIARTASVPITATRRTTLNRLI